MKHRLLFFFFILVVAIFGSCTPHRQMVYLQDRLEQGDTLGVDPKDYKVRPNDILHIRVTTLDAEAHAIFNMEDTRSMRSTTGGMGDLNLYIYGYTVNKEGKVQMPVVGEVEVSGLTIDETRRRIQEEVDNYLIGATVSVKMANFSVSVVGEVNSPGNFYVYDNEFTIMDAIALAGDLTDFGNREVNVVRRTGDGLIFASIDLAGRDIVESDYYFLQPGDLVYVEPYRVKRLGFAQFPFAVLFSAISTTVLLITFIQ